MKINSSAAHTGKPVTKESPQQARRLDTFQIPPHLQQQPANPTTEPPSTPNDPEIPRLDDGAKTLGEIHVVEKPIVNTEQVEDDEGGEDEEEQEEEGEGKESQQEDDEDEDEDGDELRQEDKKKKKKTGKNKVEKRKRQVVTASTLKYIESLPPRKRVKKILSVQQGCREAIEQLSKAVLDDEKKTRLTRSQLKTIQSYAAKPNAIYGDRDLKALKRIISTTAQEKKQRINYYTSGYYKQQFAKMHKPGIPVTETARKIGESWRAMTKEQQDAFKAEFEKSLEKESSP